MIKDYTMKMAVPATAYHTTFSAASSEEAQRMAMKRWPENKIIEIYEGAHWSTEEARATAKRLPVLPEFQAT